MRGGIPSAASRRRTDRAAFAGEGRIPERHRDSRTRRLAPDLVDTPRRRYVLVGPQQQKQRARARCFVLPSVGSRPLSQATSGTRTPSSKAQRMNASGARSALAALYRSFALRRVTPLPEWHFLLSTDRVARSRRRGGTPMFSTTNTKLAGVAVVVCAFAVAPQALATTNVHGVKASAKRVHRVDPGIAAAITSHRAAVTASDMRSPDTRDAVARSTGLDPSSAAAITSHRAAVTASDMRSPDTLDAVVRSTGLDPSSAAAITSHRAAVTASDMRSPDTRDAVARSTGLDPASAAAITSHRAAVTASDMRSPDTLDAVAQSGRLDPSSAAAITSHRAAVTATDMRSPDTRDATGVIAAATATPRLAVVASNPIFDWTDAGIGAVAGFAIALLLAGMILRSHRGRHGRLAV